MGGALCLYVGYVPRRIYAYMIQEVAKGKEHE